jgi:hypothetical protein
VLVLLIMVDFTKSLETHLKLIVCAYLIRDSDAAKIVDDLVGCLNILLLVAADRRVQVRITVANS